MSQPPSANVTWGGRAATWTAPLLLVAIALLQIVRVHRYRQSTWAGVGFGMFATVDNHGTRFVRGFVSEGDVEKYSPLPPALADDAMKARVVPTDERARRLAERWLHLAPARVVAVRVEVWGPVFESATRSLTARRLATSERVSRGESQP